MKVKISICYSVKMIVLKTSYIKFSEKMIRDAKENFIRKLETDVNKPLVARDIGELSKFKMMLKF